MGCSPFLGWHTHPACRAPHPAEHSWESPASQPKKPASPPLTLFSGGTRILRVVLRILRSTLGEGQRANPGNPEVPGFHSSWATCSSLRIAGNLSKQRRNIDCSVFASKVAGHSSVKQYWVHRPRHLGSFASERATSYTVGNFGFMAMRRYHTVQVPLPPAFSSNLVGRLKFLIVVIHCSGGSGLTFHRIQISMTRMT